MASRKMSTSVAQLERYLALEQHVKAVRAVLVGPREGLDADTAALLRTLGCELDRFFANRATLHPELPRRSGESGSAVDDAASHLREAMSLVQVYAAAVEAMGRVLTSDIEKRLDAAAAALQVGLPGRK